MINNPPVGSPLKLSKQGTNITGKVTRQGTTALNALSRQVTLAIVDKEGTVMKLEE
jgi:hypothetical protein